MKRIITIIAILILTTAGNLFAGGRTKESASISVRVIFPATRIKTSVITHSSVNYKNTPEISKKHIYIISKSGKKFTYKVNANINYDDFESMINSIIGTLPKGDYIAICKINGSPVAYRFRIPSL